MCPYLHLIDGDRPLDRSLTSHSPPASAVSEGSPSDVRSTTLNQHSAAANSININKYSLAGYRPTHLDSKGLNSTYAHGMPCSSYVLSQTNTINRERERDSKGLNSIYAHGMPCSSYVLSQTNTRERERETLNCGQVGTTIRRSALFKGR